MNDFAPGPWAVTAAEYHATDGYVSNSALKVFRGSVPKYHGLCIAGTIAQEETDALRFGRATHSLIEGAEVYDSLYAVAPGGIDRRTNLGKESWAAFLAASEGKTTIDAKEDALVRAVVDGIRRNPSCAEFIDSDGPRETATRWLDPITKRPCKALLDKLGRDAADRRVIVDVKTMEDIRPAAWVRQVLKFGYHNQNAWYLDGLWEACREEAEFVFIAVGKKPPHESVPYLLDAEFLTLGRQQNRAALNELDERLSSGDWTSRFHGKVLVAQCPRWAGRTEDIEVDNEIESGVA